MRPARAACRLARRGVLGGRPRLRVAARSADRGEPVLTWWEGTIPNGYGTGEYVIADYATAPPPDPVAAPFASLALITPMLPAADGLYTYAPGAGRVLLDVFLVLTVLLEAWFTGQWIYGPVQLEAFHPGYFLPTAGSSAPASRKPCKPGPTAANTGLSLNESACLGQACAGTCMA
jgi:hypothetical protein